MPEPEFNPSQIFLDAACKAMISMAEEVQALADAPGVSRISRELTTNITRLLPSLRNYIPGLNAPEGTAVSKVLREDAFKALRSKDPLEALQLALRGLASAPHDSRLWHAAALAYLHTGAMETAETLLKHARWCNLSNPEVLADLERLQLHYGGYGACAIPDAPALAAAVLPPNHGKIALKVASLPAATCTIGDLCNDLETLAESISAAKGAGESNSTYAPIAAGLSLVLEGLRKHPPRPEELRPSFETQLSHGDASYLLEQDRHPIAALWITLRGLSRAPHSPTLWHLTAIICLEFNDVQRCREILEHVLWIDPSYSDAQQDLDGLVGFREEDANGGSAPAPLHDEPAQRDEMPE